MWRTHHYPAPPRDPRSSCLLLFPGTACFELQKSADTPAALPLLLCQDGSIFSLICRERGRTQVPHLSTLLRALPWPLKAGQSGPCVVFYPHLSSNTSHIPFPKKTSCGKVHGQEKVKPGPTATVILSLKMELGSSRHKGTEEVVSSSCAGVLRFVGS